MIAESGGSMVRLRLAVIFCVLMFCCESLFAQTTAPEPSQLPTAPYRLFRTTNMWTFIKLDTVTGKMWQMQFDVQGDNRGSSALNLQDLTNGKENSPGRFTLYPTLNIYTFILVDQIDGRTWQVQWSMERENRLVMPIY
jgi:hypothetical protein